MRPSRTTDALGPSARSQPRAGLETRHALARGFLGALDAADVYEEKLNSDVYRLGCAANGVRRSFVAKRLDPDIARRNELVARRWLPAAGLRGAAPPLLAVAAEPDGSSVWHLYTDLGDRALDAKATDPMDVEHAVAAIAAIHMRFRRHALLPECRLWGADLGISMYTASVNDAIASIESLRARRRPLSRTHSSLCRRLLARLTDLRAESAARADTLTRLGGPDTLLHGDLWPMNVILSSSGDRTARLIDWDHAGIGPISYDLSTFLARFPAEERVPLLRKYEDEAVRASCRLPAPAQLNEMFETAELGRIANRVIWPALAVWEHDAVWGFEALREVERWFEALTPVLPLEEACSRS
jgi:hypothetical protein